MLIHYFGGLTAKPGVTVVDWNQLDDASITLHTTYNPNDWNIEQVDWRTYNNVNLTATIDGLARTTAAGAAAIDNFARTTATGYRNG